MKRTFTLLLLLALILPGCGAPKIDTSTDENMKSSIATVRESLPQEKRGDFDRALRILAFSEVDLKDIFTEAATGAGTIEGEMKTAIHGKSGLEVIAAADEIVRKRKEKEKAQALKEIDELEQKKTAADKAREELARFEVLRSRFYKTRGFIGEQPVIELTVKNGTIYPVSRAYFVGTLASPGRAVPWLRESFNHSISGGLEPGEEATWELAPNMFGEWGTVEAPKDAILTVEVERLDGPDGKALFSTRTFTEYDEKRLKALKEQFGG